MRLENTMQKLSPVDGLAYMNIKGSCLRRTMRGLRLAKGGFYGVIEHYYLETMREWALANTEITGRRNKQFFFFNQRLPKSGYPLKNKVWSNIYCVHMFKIFYIYKGRMSRTPKKKKVIEGKWLMSWVSFLNEISVLFWKEIPKTHLHS